jgi:uncharacterized protein (TIGR00106 family)
MTIESFYTIQEQLFNMIVAEFAVVPMGEGTSVSNYIKAVEDMLRRSGVKFVPGAMSTTMETNTLRETFDLVEKADKILADMGVQRMITMVRIDHRLDKDTSIEAKINAVK